jgi:hypothetical protein
VWSTNTAPFFMPWNAPPSPTVTWRTSASLPTQAKTKSASLAASAGVGALLPPNLSAQAFALSAAAVVHGDLVPAALGQVTGHRIAHHAKPDPRCSLAHCLASFVLQSIGDVAGGVESDDPQRRPLGVSGI